MYDDFIAYIINAGIDKSQTVSTQYVRDRSGNPFLSASAKKIETDSPTAAAADTHKLFK